MERLWGKRCQRPAVRVKLECLPLPHPPDPITHKSPMQTPKAIATPPSSLPLNCGLLASPGAPAHAPRWPPQDSGPGREEVKSGLRGFKQTTLESGLDHYRQGLFLWPYLLLAPEGRRELRPKAERPSSSDTKRQRSKRMWGTIFQQGLTHPRLALSLLHYQ